MKMLYVYNRCASRFPLQRLIFTGAVASVFVVFILYIALNHANDLNNKMRHEKMIRTMDYNVDIIKFEVKKETQLEPIWNDMDDLEEYESFIDSGESFPELSAEEMKTLEKRMDERRQYVKDTCIQYEINKGGNINAYEFLINDKYHLIWCNIFKAASTSWMYNFNLMAGFSKKEASESQLPQAMARERYPRPSIDELLLASSNSTSMIIVRHPFERLSSAYRDKMQNCPPISMYANMADEIIMNFRIREDSNSEEGMLYPGWPTFEEFVRYILYEVESKHELDVHWAPYTPFCTPCNYDFDVIAKFETLEEDQKYLIQKAGLRNIITPQWRNSGGAKIMYKGVSSNDLMLMHYSQLTMNQISQLAEVYRYDFHVFNYTIDEYYAIAKDVEPYRIYDYSSSEEDISDWDISIE